MKVQRIAAVSAIALSLVAGSQAHAQAWPARPIKMIAPYPPGVPVLAPGETVTARALAALRTALADGGRIAYAADPALTTLQVVRD